MSEATDILLALRAGRQYLWDGQWEPQPPHLEEHVCVAITHASRDGLITKEQKRAAHRLLAWSMGATPDDGNMSLMDWLEKQGHSEWVDGSTAAQRQALRLAWMDQLIAAVEKWNHEH